MSRMLRIAVSSCLCGQPVRYDGGHKRHSGVAELSHHAELLPICPELELGLGVPRAPIQLLANGHVVCTDSRHDLSAPMEQLGMRRAKELQSAGIAGYVWKTRSPSCGLLEVQVFDSVGGSLLSRNGRGLFASVIARHFPELPMVEESELTNARQLDEFVSAARCYHARPQATG